MNIADLLQNKYGAHPDHIVGCSSHDSVQIAVKKMWDNTVGALIVLDGDNMVGIFSERDVVRLLHSNPSDFSELSLASVMTKNVISISPEQPIEDALELMKNHGIRHLPVMRNDELVGFLSLRDLMMYKIEYAKQVADFMRDQILNQGSPLPM